MRPVTTSKMQSMRRSYNRAIDGDFEPDQPTNGPYQSMYSQAFGGNNARDIDSYSQMMETPDKKR